MEVAVLLATYNGEKFVERQIRSFIDNSTPFVLHWLDDNSEDNTREVVRKTVLGLGVALKEWHLDEHQGVPAAFFRLLEYAEADLYLFSDQDDIWQPGKIDALVENLRADIGSPALCFTDPLMFRGDDLATTRRLLDVLGTKPSVAFEESRLFMAPALGHTQGFTRALRDIFVRHKHIAYEYAFMHDLWMYDIAVATGSARIIENAPTTLYRLHSSNVTGQFGSWRGRGIRRISVTWKQHQNYRRGLSRHARGFIRTSATLASGPKIDRLLHVARIVATLDRKQPLAAVIRLIQQRVLWGSSRLAIGLLIACYYSDAHH